MRKKHIKMLLLYCLLLVLTTNINKPLASAEAPTGAILRPADNYPSEIEPF